MINASALLSWISTILSTLLIPLIIKILAILLVFYVGTKIIAWARKVVNKALVKSDADKGVVTFLDSFVKLGLYAVLVIILLGMFGVEMTSIAAVVASAGVAVGLALQGSLSNLAGGVLILLLHPFGVGDYIIAGGLEGTVTEIQLFYTKLTTGDNKVVVMPNGGLSNGNIVNVSAMDKRRIDVTIGIAYHSDLKLAKDVLLEMAKNCPYALKDQEISAFVSSLESGSVVMNTRIWVKKEDYWTALSYVSENAMLTLNANNIEIPCSKVKVSVEQ